MLRFPRTSQPRPLRQDERPLRKEDLRFQRPECREKLRGIGRVAVVGGGFAGLMAARRLVQHGVKVTVFEARKEVGGRVLSNPNFSEGRITEEGAELIGSFHTKWLELAREFGLAMISRMDPDLYERECLDVKLALQDKPLSMPEFKALSNAMDERVLKPLADVAKSIEDPSRPWKQTSLKYRNKDWPTTTIDNMSVQDALPKFCQISERKKNPTDERLWKMLEFKLVNDEVAPLDEMNFLGLLCKVRAGQGERCVENESPLTDGYWQELEIFRCADGCQTLATKIAEKIQTKKYGPEPATVRRLTAVTHINLFKGGVTLGVKATKPDGKFVDDKPPLLIPGFSYVVLAIPPSVWPRVKITADGKDADPAKEIGQMRMNDAVKYFSDVKERFWIKEKSDPNRDRGSAPYGGSLRIGQVWEGTDNQTRIGKQGIVLSVFAGPVSATRRAPTRDDFDKELRRLYRGYAGNLTTRQLFSDWPNVPFIKTGYWTPYPGEIFRVGEKLTNPYHDRLFFAGEHTQMDFFGYMEGALRSGERAAATLMLSACGLLEKTAPKSPSLPPRRPTAERPSSPILARATPTREVAAFEHEIEIPLEEHSSTDYTGEAESPFLDRDLFVAGVDEKWEPRVAALVAESPFVGVLEERRSRFDEDQWKEEEAPDELEGEEELEAEEVWEELEEEQLTPQADEEEDESLDDEGAPLREDETELESPEDFEELYGHGHEQELDQGEEFAELKEAEGLESNEEELDWRTEDSGEEDSERDEEESVQVELDVPKRGAKKSSLHSVPTTNIFMHVYFKKLSAGYTRQQFFDWIVNQSPGEMGPNRFELAGVGINLVSNPSTAVSDFEGSLKAEGSVVVYFGHTVLGPKATLGLAPNDPPAKPGITCAKLTNLLNAAKAKIVVLAGCATSQCVIKIKGDTVVIVTQSGKDRLTNTLVWAPAIKALLDALLASGTVGDALAAANNSFAKVSSTDSFKMINGDPTLKMI